MKALLLPLLMLGATACDAQAPAGGPQRQSLAALDAPSKALPGLTGRVVDRAELLDEEAEAALTRRLAALEKATTDQLVVVTVPSLDGESIEELGLRLGNGWGVGRKDAGNGVLLILAAADRRARIEVGKGLQGLLTDEEAQRIMDKQLVPRFRQGEYVEGIEAGVAAIEATLRSDPRRPRLRARQAI